ncbi:MAG: CPBP family intramembrane glutamic endopeptidase [Polyangiales bacterium]
MEHTAYRAPAPFLSPPPRPRVWTVAVACLAVAALMAAQMGVTLMRAALIAAERAPDHKVTEAALREVLREGATPSMLVVAALASIATFAGVAFAAAALSPKRVVDRLSLGRSRAPAAMGALAFAALLGWGTLCDAAREALGLPSSAHEIARMIHRSSPAEFAALVLLVGAGAGAAEEVFFRGYVQTRLRDRWGPRAAIGVTAVLFGVAHLDPVHSFFAVGAGVILGALADGARSIRPAIAAHALNNAVSVVGSRFSDPDERAGGAALAVLAVTSALALGFAGYAMAKAIRAADAPAPSAG